MQHVPNRSIFKRTHAGMLEAVFQPGLQGPLSCAREDVLCAWHHSKHTLCAVLGAVLSFISSSQKPC